MNDSTQSPIERYYAYVNSRLQGLRANRYTWWCHWRELADFFLPRRYKWLITPNQWNRGSPINQHIIDSSGVLAARNLAAGLASGKSSPIRPWFSLRLGYIDSTQTSPISLWLAECERLMRAVFQESNFYNCIAQFYYDLVIFGTAVLLIYEDYENVINCFNPCAGEYYVDIDGQYRPCILYREFTMTIGAVVDRFGIDNVSSSVREAYNSPDGSARTREIVVAHAIEPNNDGKARSFGVSERFAFRECYWEYGQGPQSGAAPGAPKFLEIRGYFEQPHCIVRWDIVSNDAYGRSVAMDALGDQKQLQLETRRKAQAIDKLVNPPLVADVQLKNQPSSLMPGAITYVSGYTASGKPGIATIYDTKFDVTAVSTDLEEVRGRLRYTFYNHLFQPISQFETRSNVTAVEIDQRRAEALIMLGPVFQRIDNEGLRVIVERVFGIMSRAGIFPPPPPEIEGAELSIEFTSLLSMAQDAVGAASIERALALVGNLVAVDPGALDNIDVDFTIDKYAKLLNNDPRMIRSPEEVAMIRQQRAQQQQQMQQAEIAEKLAQGAKNLSSADLGGGTNALQALTGVAGQ